MFDRHCLFCSIVLWFIVATCHDVSADEAPYDILIRGGTLYDGSGKPGVVGDIAIRGDRIAAVGDLKSAAAGQVIDAQGLAIAPGFINMLSWAGASLLVDGRSQSDIRQGVTLEVFGEGWSMGPLNDRLKKNDIANQGDVKYDVTWRTLGEFLNHLAAHGTSPNVASFVGATTIRMHVIGNANRAPTAAELQQMRQLVQQAMDEGAMGVGSSLIYAPAFYAKTPELVELCKVASAAGGMYTSHLRSEGNQLLEATGELIEIARKANIRAEVYHLKAAGESNWSKQSEAIALIERARADGLEVTANMYLYTAGSTGLTAAMPPWAQEGGITQWIERLRNPQTRARVLREMRTPSNDWENLLLGAGSPERVLLIGFKNAKLKPYTGKTLAEVAALRGTSPEECAMDLVIEDHSRVDTIYFMMSEENVRRNVALPWVSFGSDGASQAPEGAFLRTSTHPRTYGNVARLLGKYVREENIIPLEEAIRRLTNLPATNLRIRERGLLTAGYFADVVAFDPATIQEHATYEKPQQYATGVKHVWVNGVRVLADGEHTGAKPGRAVWGPGRKTAK